MTSAGAGQSSEAVEASQEEAAHARRLGGVFALGSSQVAWEGGRAPSLARSPRALSHPFFGVGREIDDGKNTHRNVRAQGVAGDMATPGRKAAEAGRQGSVLLYGHRRNGRQSFVAFCLAGRTLTFCQLAGFPSNR